MTNILWRVDDLTDAKELGGTDVLFQALLYSYERLF